MKFHLFLLMLAVALVSCSKDDTNPDPTDMLLTGKVRGVPFTYGSGRFVDFGPQVTTFGIRIDNAGPMVTDSCDTNSDDVYVRVDVPKAVGKRILSEENDIDVTFFHPDMFQALIVYGEGFYDVLSFTEDQLVIEFDVHRDEDNYLKGRCTVYRCN